MQGESYLPEALAFVTGGGHEPEIVRYAEVLVRGVWEHRRRFDGLITNTLEHWSLDRLSGVDRNLLRVALFEMLECDDVPEKVAINEAIEIAKAFGDAESPRFVNGILDAIRRCKETTTDE